MRDGSMASSDSEQWFCTALDAQDKPIDDLVVLYVGSERVKTKDVRFDFATGPWEPTDVRAAAEELGGTKGEVRFSRAESLRDGTYVGLFVDNDRMTRIMGQGVKRLRARDAGGKTHVAIPFQGRFTGDGPPDEPLEKGYLFTDLAPADLQEVWLERRVVDKWIEFRDVSFESGVETEVRVVTSDDPPDEADGEGL